MCLNLATSVPEQQTKAIHLRRDPISLNRFDFYLVVTNFFNCGSGGGFTSVVFPTVTQLALVGSKSFQIAGFLFLL